MTTAAPNPFKIFPLFQLSVISYQWEVGSDQLSVGRINKNSLLSRSLPSPDRFKMFHRLIFTVHRQLF
ncbi:MAG: hypothetical protein EWV50_12705 [Microcystis aeruginosa Ma_MB_F_20061100_S20]|uniref:Uncharacterized protein n=1 Tax=Microcystis aeruginosa Ma_MB_F_20061100_S20D TaxID=2486253 RepID=A0A552ELD8_MICAE|nr:MAG: hypothetical protein EWV78_11330 [Microcystis aeruginosa Ma_MB_F_20061100_S20D]TRU37937.1 MAG: hypothetical protein EWV50_12705 [Microcystis aeruginosa Ma_MB_F_20061100_S20]